MQVAHQNNSTLIIFAILMANRNYSVWNIIVLLVFETAYNKLKFYVSNWSLDVQQHVLNVSLCSENSGLKQHLFELVRLKYEMIEGSWEDIYAASQTKYEGWLLWREHHM